MSVLCILIYISPFRSFCFIGSRIKGTISVYIDGEQIDLSKENFDGVNIRDDGRSVTLKDRGKGYGQHTFCMVLQEIDCPINITVCQWDWHQVTRFDCKIYFKTDERGFTASYISDNRKLNENKTTTETYSKEFDNISNGIEVLII